MGGSQPSQNNEWITWKKKKKGQEEPTVSLIYLTTITDTGSYQEILHIFISIPFSQKFYKYKYITYISYFRITVE